MYIKSSEYLSKFTGKQIDDAIDNIRDYTEELAQKVDKSTTINGYPLSENVELTAGDVGALSNDIQYGASIDFDDGNLSLMDQDGALINSVYVYPSWEDIQGDDIGANAVLQGAFDEKQNIIDLNNTIDADFVDDTNSVHKFATEIQLQQIDTNTSDIAIINSKIPSQATSENKLTDKNFVNSSIATNTAYFIGTFQSVAELEAYSGTLTNNDYAFVESTDSAGNSYYDRYKYNASTETWIFEYKLNNTRFTSDQWASITSGITAQDVTQIATNTSDIASININLATKSTVTFVDWTTE